MDKTRIRLYDVINTGTGIQRLKDVVKAVFEWKEPMYPDIAKFNSGWYRFAFIETDDDGWRYINYRACQGLDFSHTAQAVMDATNGTKC